MRYTFSVFFALLSFFPLVAHGENRELTIGAVLHLSGDLAVFSLAFQEGIELAVAEHNAQNKHPVRLIVEDGRGEARTSNTAVRKLISTDKASVLLLSSYFDAAASEPEFEKKLTPAVVLWNANPELDAMNDFVFSLGAWTPSAGELAADFAIYSLKAKSAVVCVNNDPWGESVAKYFAARFTDRGGRILDTVFINPDGSDLPGVVSHLQTLNPEVVYSPLSFNIVAFYKQLHGSAWNKPIVTSEIISEEHVRSAPNAFEGIYQTQIANPSGSEFQALAAKYEAHFHKPIRLPWFTARAYDGAQIILKAFDSGVTSGAELEKHLYTIKGFKGASGDITILSTGSAPVMESMFRIETGKFVPQTPAVQ